MRISGISSSGYRIVIEIKCINYRFTFHEELNSYTYGLNMIDSEGDKWYVTDINKKEAYEIIDTIAKQGWYILDDDMILYLL